MGKERRVNPACKNASNPYHECGEYCLEKIAEAKARLVFIKKQNARLEEMEGICFLESNTCVSVGKYRVNSAVSTTLTSIIDKHGDIVENCKLVSPAMRSRYLECLCTLVEELETTPVGYLTELNVRAMLAVLKDLEAVNIDVSWLRLVLEEFAQYQEKRNSEKERQEGLVRAKKQELEIQEADLARMEEDVVKAKLRAEKRKEELDELETEQLLIEKMGSNDEIFKGKAYLDQLF